MIHPHPTQRLTANPAAAGGIPVLAVDEPTMAEALGISPTHLANLRKRGEFPHALLGNRLVYPIDVVRRHLDTIAQGTRPTGREDQPSPA